MWLWPRSPLRNATASGQYTVAKGARKSPRKYKVNHTHLGCPWQSQDLPLWIIILHFKNRQDTCWCREKRCKLKRKNMKQLCWHKHIQRKANRGHSFVYSGKSRLWGDNFYPEFPSSHGLGESWIFRTLPFNNISQQPHTTATLQGRTDNGHGSCY